MMANVRLQQQARAAGRKLKSPTVKVRKSSLSDTCAIIEVTAPDGSSLLIDVDTHRDGSGLRVSPRNASAEVTLQIASGHGGDCWLMRSSADDAACTCGSSYRYDPSAFGWGPHVGLYFSVIIPWEDDAAKRTEWHPSSKAGPFALLSRGAFDTVEQAHAWAKEKLGPDARYSVRAFERGY